MSNLQTQMSDKRALEVGTTIFSYISEDIISDLLIGSDIASALTGLQLSSNPPGDLEPVPDSVLAAEILGKSEYRPRETSQVWQKGYKLMVLQYSFDGAAGGHVGHSGGYTNGWPAELRVSDGQTVPITAGPACGTLTERVTVYTYDGRSGTATGQANVKVS